MPIESEKHTEPVIMDPEDPKVDQSAFESYRTARPQKGNEFSIQKSEHSKSEKYLRLF